MWLDFFTVNIFRRLTVKILSFLRLTAKFLAVLRLTVNPIETLLNESFNALIFTKMLKEEECMGVDEDASYEAAIPDILANVLNQFDHGRISCTTLIAFCTCCG